jgi:hypothetical protein
MLETQFYLSDEANLKQAQELTGLSLDEIEHVVGRFGNQSSRAGQLKGEVIVVLGEVKIRHHFTKKVLWTYE